MTPDLLGLIRVLSQAGVQYIIVGGVAANVHGALRTTLDLDVVYSRERENVARLAAALRPYNPYPRGAPAGLPFIFDAATIERGLNFSLTTSLGDLDLLGEVTGGGTYDRLRPGSEPIELENLVCLVVSLATLVALKRASGRPKDREVLAELEVLLEEQERSRE
jgi:hypothetical protein